MLIYDFIPKKKGIKNQKHVTYSYTHYTTTFPYPHVVHSFLEHVAVRSNNCMEKKESLTGTWTKIFLAGFIKSVIQLHSSWWDHNVLMSVPTDDFFVVFPSRFLPPSAWPTLHHFSLMGCIKYLKSFKPWRSVNAPDTNPQLLLAVAYMLDTSQQPFTDLNYHFVSCNCFSPRSTGLLREFLLSCTIICRWEFKQRLYGTVSSSLVSVLWATTAL